MTATYNIGIIVSDFNEEITSAMTDKASETIKGMGHTVISVQHVPGAFDIPLICHLMLKRKDIDGIICLGAVIKGETGHDKVVAENAARKIADLTVMHEKPVTLGIIGPGASWELADSRKEQYAIHAAEAVIHLLNTKKGIGQ